MILRQARYTTISLPGAALSIVCVIMCFKPEKALAGRLDAARDH